MAVVSDGVRFVCSKGLAFIWRCVDPSLDDNFPTASVASTHVPVILLYQGMGSPQVKNHCSVLSGLSRAGRSNNLPSCASIVEVIWGKLVPPPLMKVCGWEVKDVEELHSI